MSVSLERTSGPTASAASARRSWLDRISQLPGLSPRGCSVSSPGSRSHAPDGRDRPKEALTLLARVQRGDPYYRLRMLSGTSACGCWGCCQLTMTARVREVRSVACRRCDAEGSAATHGGSGKTVHGIPDAAGGRRTGERQGVQVNDPACRRTWFRLERREITCDCEVYDADGRLVVVQWTGLHRGVSATSRSWNWLWNDGDRVGGDEMTVAETERADLLAPASDGLGSRGLAICNSARSVHEDASVAGRVCRLAGHQRIPARISQYAAAGAAWHEARKRAHGAGLFPRLRRAGGSGCRADFAGDFRARGSA